MKVHISNINPSPFRDLSVYNYIDGKLSSLEESIDKSGLWKNMICRPLGNQLDGVEPAEIKAAVAKINADLGLEGVYDGLVEIPWGHHRVEAARRKGLDYIYFTMEALTDDEMLYHLAAENKDDYGSNMQVFLETVTQIYQNLLGKVQSVATFPEFKEKFGDAIYKTKAAFDQAKGEHGISSGALQKMLGDTWSQKDIGFALSAIKAIEGGEFDRGTVISMPTVRHMGEFCKFVAALKEKSDVYPEFFVNKFMDEAATLISDPDKGVAIRVLEGVRNHIKGGKDPLAYLTRQTVKKFDLKDALDKLTGGADSKFKLEEVESTEGLMDFPDIDKVVQAVRESRAAAEAKAAAKEPEGDDLDKEIAEAEGEAGDDLGVVDPDAVADSEELGEAAELDESAEAVNQFDATVEAFTGVAESLYAQVENVEFTEDLTAKFEAAFKALAKIGMVMSSKTALKKLVDTAEKEM